VVPRDSATIAGSIPIGIRKDHREMARFSTKQDDGFLALCGELRRWTRDIEAHTNSHPSHPACSHGIKTENEQRDVKCMLINRLSRTSKRGMLRGVVIVPYPYNEGFVGRGKVLQQLKDQFRHGQDTTSPKSQRRASLYGLGGIGYG
jgi:hypothetical protein